MSTDVNIGGFVFRCDTDIEEYRAKTLFTKEAGTVKWLQDECRLDDVVYDVGANIGIYTILASSLVGPNGHVYAFEPHIVNAAALMRNVQLNKCHNVTVITSPLDSHHGMWLPFHYASIVAGTSGSQFGHCRDERGRVFTPVAIELKSSVTLERLIRNGAIKPADLLKVDVDGNEPAILAGLFAAVHKNPRAIQVEMHQQTAHDIEFILGMANYQIAERHDTLNGKQAIANGADQDTVAHNRIFRRAA